MNPEQKQTLIAFIKETIDKFPKYDFTTFIEDAIEIRANFKSIIRTNRINLISSINKLRQILRENQKLFIPVFTNIFPHFLELINNENAHNVPEEALFLIFDIFTNLMMNITFQSKWKSKLFSNLLQLSSILNTNNSVNRQNTSNLDLIKSYVDFILQIFLDAYKKNINLLIDHFSSKDKNLQATAAFWFFNNLNQFGTDKEALNEIAWEKLLANCSIVLNSGKDYSPDNKNCCIQIYQQLYSFYSRGQGINDIILRILVKGTKQSAYDFGKANEINVNEAIEILVSTGQD